MAEPLSDEEAMYRLQDGIRERKKQLIAARDQAVGLLGGLSAGEEMGGQDFLDTLQEQGVDRGTAQLAVASLVRQGQVIAANQLFGRYTLNPRYTPVSTS